MIKLYFNNQNEFSIYYLLLKNPNGLDIYEIMSFLKCPKTTIINRINRMTQRIVEFEKNGYMLRLTYLYRKKHKDNRVGRPKTLFIIPNAIRNTLKSFEIIS